MSIASTMRLVMNHPISGRHKLRALTRYLRWQVSSRLALGATLIHWVGGARVLVRSGETGFSGNIYMGLHEFPEMGFVLHVMRAGDLFVDVGANVGSYTMLACAARGACGVAFEPVPDTYAKLVDNVRINGLEGVVTCHSKAVGNEPGAVKFSSDQDTVNHAVHEGEEVASAVVVSVVTLDEALHITSPAMLKIDVEGYETRVVQGAQTVLANPLVHSVIMELNGSGKRYGFDESLIQEQMQQLGFREFTYDPMMRRLTPSAAGPRAADNVLFIRDQELVEHRLGSSPPTRILGVEF